MMHGEDNGAKSLMNEQLILKGISKVQVLSGTSVILVATKEVLLKFPIGHGYCEYAEDGVPKIWNGYKCIKFPKDCVIGGEKRLYITPIYSLSKNYPRVRFLEG